MRKQQKKCYVDGLVRSLFLFCFQYQSCYIFSVYILINCFNNCLKISLNMEVELVLWKFELDIPGAFILKISLITINKIWL